MRGKVSLQKLDHSLSENSAGSSVGDVVRRGCSVAMSVKVGCLSIEDLFVD